MSTLPECCQNATNAITGISIQLRSEQGQTCCEAETASPCRYPGCRALLDFVCVKPANIAVRIRGLGAAPDRPSLQLVDSIVVQSSSEFRLDK